MMKQVTDVAKAAKRKVENFIVCKQCGIAMEDGDHLVEVLGTIIIAVVILIFFRKEIVGLFESMMNSTTNKVNNLFNNVTP